MTEAQLILFICFVMYLHVAAPIAYNRIIDGLSRKVKIYAFLSIYARIILETLAVFYLLQGLFVLIGGNVVLPIFGKSNYYGFTFILLAVIFITINFLIASIDKYIHAKFIKSISDN